MGLYEYRAHCARVVDGDTIWLSWKDYGDGLKVYGGNKSATALSYRLASVNAYEKSLRYGTTPEEKAIGLKATQWLRELIEGKTILVKSVRSGSKGGYGRYLAYIFLDTPDATFDPQHPGTCINRMLLDQGFAVVSKYPDGDIYDGLGYEREEK